MSEVAILLATYNGEKYISELVKSLMEQSYQDFVCYVHDDGSNDNTVSIIRNIQNQYSEKFVILDYPATGSSKANFMSMLNYVKEPYVMFADQDDFWLPDKVEVSLNAIKNMEDKNEPIPILVFTDLEVVDSELRTIKESFMKTMKFDPTRIKYQQLMAENVGAGCTMIMNKSLLEIVKRLKEICNIRMHDGWFMVVAAIYGNIYYINRPTILYRQHESNVLGSKKSSFISRLWNNIKFFMNGTNKAKKNEWLTQIDSMAIELLKFEDLPTNVRRTLNELVLIHNKTKLCRIMFYIKNEFLRNNRNPWMLMWV